MASPDPAAVERQMYYDLLGITTSSLSLSELRDLTGGGVNARRAASAAGISEEGLPGTILTDNITDSTAVGRAVLKAVDQAAARTAIDGAQAAHTHGVNDLTATGVKDPTTFLRGDNTWAVPAGGGGGVTDHGALLGLADDDHPQYHNNARGDARYEPLKGVDDNFVTDAEKTALHGHANKVALDLVSGTNTGDQVLPTWTTISGKPAVVGAGTTQTTARAAINAADAAHLHSGVYAPVLGADDNYVTDAEKVKLTNLSGTNTGDQTLPTWSTISGKPAVIAAGATAADARTAVDAAQTVHSHFGTYEPLKGIDDNFVTDTEKVKLSNLSGINTGDQTLPTWSTIAGKPAVIAEGATATDARTAISAAAATHTHVATTDLTATGTKNSTTFLRGDNTWAAPSGGSDPWTSVIATTDTSNDTITSVSCAGLVLSGLADGLYEFEANILGQTPSTGTGVQVGLSYGNTADVNAMLWGIGTSGSAQTFLVTNTNGTTGVVAATGAPYAGIPFLACVMKGTFRAATMVDNIVVTVRTETATSLVYVKADSFIRYRRVSA